MKRISEEELAEIVTSYGVNNLVFEQFMQVEPDTAVYIFHDDKNAKYVLLASDYLGGYSEFELPHEFVFDYYPNDKIKFNAIRKFSYLDNALKAAIGYTDDKHAITQATTGDACMLFSVDKIS